MKNDILEFDLETSGLDPKKNAVIQIAGLIERNGEVKEEFNILCAPFPDDIIEPEALEINGRTEKEIRAFQPPAKAYAELIKIFGKYVNKFDKKDKFTPAGYNVRFDLDFLAQFFLKNGDKYFGSWQNWRAIDPMYLVNFYAANGAFNLENHKLATVYKFFFNKEFDAHDALADIKATREIRLFFQTTIFPEGADLWETPGGKALAQGN